ncbi:UDP-N-acetylmuramoyl-L-alanyl-D-glutamate--2,6-diaminopimelate ligase [Enterocloster asparagiformis]|uniref:UDP-N-acetylmuramoyl-L-alanyl-D-glutamate--2, 6-diaminopimelate ligase n=1 Tax=Enterocloster asparagiformis TaxID=333367 RepID=UPI002A821FE4|nr:UDP-N-acetylmuramoyl-L-alanyl-D-glutamate--2,6-diaminopimelate ligase [Enterocloster asparagiformis]
MVLSDWLEGLDYELLQGSLEVQVSDVSYDSRKAKEGDVFVCMTGTRVDSHLFIPQVEEAGVRVIVIERPLEELLKAVSPQVTVLRVKDGRRALALLSAARFGYPARKMITVGVTGTKGKTTTTHMIKAILEAAGKKVGMIGTNGTVIGDRVTPNLNTTPESYQLHQAFADMVEAGCEYMIMEVSSQGIKMHRTDGLFFDYGLFTNISPDHIGPDEHADFGEYLYYKSRLMTMCKVGLVNRGDEHYEGIIKDASCRLYTYCVAEGDGASADFEARNIRYVAEENFVGTEFDVTGRLSMDVRLGIPGLFNVDNALAAMSLCSFMGLDKQRMSHALEHIRINGRMEIVHTSKRCTVLVDYAHNAVSMESLLGTLRNYHPKRLVCVFGCGGNRSKDRRYSMGEIGGRMADLCVLTADNSRYEKPEDIIADIRSSIEKTGGNFVEIPDRRQAIEYSIKNARPGDMIAIIGKGHEDYQEICGVRHHFLDREVIEETVKKLGERA